MNSTISKITAKARVFFRDNFPIPRLKPEVSKPGDATWLLQSARRYTPGSYSRPSDVAQAQAGHHVWVRLVKTHGRASQ